jgi:epoxyqueuosine reductase
MSVNEFKSDDSGRVKNKRNDKQVDNSRRDVLKAAGWIALGAVGSMALGRPESEASARVGEAVRSLSVLKGVTAADIFQVSEDFKRFDAKKISFARSASDKTSAAYGSLAKQTLVFEERVRRGEVGFNLADYSLSNASRAVCISTGAGFGNRDSGLYSWKSLGVNKIPSDVSPLRKPPALLSDIVKKASKSLGADLVGMCKLDQRWVYANDGNGIPFVFEDVEDPYATSAKIVIPTSFQSVVVLAVKMDFDKAKYAPFGVSMGAWYEGYDEMAIVASRVAEFIRGVGYKAIPCGNDTALSIPLAIDAGLGQFGRICRLVTPEYGPCIRLMKVLTNMPLAYDSPIDFGLTDFCNNCKKCVNACPPKALPFGDPAWDGPTVSEMKGVLKWRQYSDGCLRWWGEVGTPCGICIRSCPWTAGIMKDNETAKYLVEKFPALNSMWKRLDDFASNGVALDPAAFWKK